MQIIASTGAFGTGLKFKGNGQQFGQFIKAMKEASNEGKTFKQFLEEICSK